jgi:hypothetical protein
MEIKYAKDQNGIQIDHATATPHYFVINHQSLDEGIQYLNMYGYTLLSDVVSEVQKSRSPLIPPFFMLSKLHWEVVFSIFFLRSSKLFCLN